MSLSDFVGSLFAPATQLTPAPNLGQFGQSVFESPAYIDEQNSRSALMRDVFEHRYRRFSNRDSAIYAELREMGPMEEEWAVAWMSGRAREPGAS